MIHGGPFHGSSQSYPFCDFVGFLWKVFAISSTEPSLLGSKCPELKRKYLKILKENVDQKECCIKDSSFLKMSIKHKNRRNLSFKSEHNLRNFNSTVKIQTSKRHIKTVLTLVIGTDKNWKGFSLTKSRLASPVT